MRISGGSLESMVLLLECKEATIRKGEDGV